jgi:glycosyltransferase involved in cell wall biosynthesis
VFLGQLVERKGIKVLIRAMALMKVDADLLLVGGDWNDPGYPRQVRDLIRKLELTDRVHIENHRPDVLAIFRRCDAFVLPSLSEARARSIIEAMSVGLPVVSTRVGGIPTLVEDAVTGLLVPPSDSEALAAALDCIAASSGLRTQFGDAGRARATEECQPQRTARRFLQLYQHLIGVGPAPA